MTNIEILTEIPADLSVEQLMDLLVELGREEWRLQQREIAIRARIGQLQEADSGYYSHNKCRMV